MLIRLTYKSCTAITIKFVILSSVTKIQATIIIWRYNYCFHKSDIHDLVQNKYVIKDIEHKKIHTDGSDLSARKTGKINSNELAKSLIISKLAVSIWVMTLKLNAENCQDSLNVQTSIGVGFPKVV